MGNKNSKIHPDLQQIADKTPKFLFSHKNLWLIKGIINFTPAPKTPEELLVENIFIPGQDDRTKIRLRIYKPKSISSPTPVLIWLHGGGYVMGKPEMDDRRCAQYVRELGITIVSVDYRYAPKHPFPGGLEDSYSALLLDEPGAFLDIRQTPRFMGSFAGSTASAAPPSWRFSTISTWFLSTSTAS